MCVRWDGCALGCRLLILQLKIRREGDHKTTAMLEKDKGQQTCERLAVDLFLSGEEARKREGEGEGEGSRQAGGREPARMTLFLLAHKTAHAVVQTLVLTPMTAPTHTARLWAVDLVSVVQVRLGRLRLSSPAVLVFPRLEIATKKDRRRDGWTATVRYHYQGQGTPDKGPRTRRTLLAYQRSTIGPRRRNGARFPLHRVNLARLSQRLRLTQCRPYGGPRLAVLPLSEQPRPDDSLTSFDRVTIE